MLAMADISTVLNNSGGSTTYSALQAAGGDNSAAIWRNNAFSAYIGFRPELRYSSRDNGNKTARRVDFQYTYPQLFTAADGSVVVKNRFNFVGSIVVPKEMTETSCVEAAWQSTGLISSSLIRFGIYQGISPA